MFGEKQNERPTVKLRDKKKSNKNLLLERKMSIKTLCEETTNN